MDCEKNPTICPLPDISYAYALLVLGKTLVGLNIFNCCKESLQMYQLEVITSTGKWLKWFKIKISACHSYFYANMLYFFKQHASLN